jgi:hypothetical protein
MLFDLARCFGKDSLGALLAQKILYRDLRREKTELSASPNIASPFVNHEIPKARIEGQPHSQNPDGFSELQIGED